MQHKTRHTIKTRITLITVSFSLILAVLLSSLSFGFFRDYARRSVIQSTEFNLQLIAGMLSQELTELEMLTKWCGTNLQIAGYLLGDSENTALALEAFERFKEEFWNNRSREYIRRLIVTDSSFSKILQSGNNMSESWPVNVYNLPQLGLAGVDSPQIYQYCAVDPFAIGKQAQVIPIIRPIFRVGSRELIGYVYLAVSADVILNHLRNYNMAPDCNLFLELSEATYRIDGTKFTDITGLSSLSDPRREMTLGERTVVRDFRLGSGSSLLVTYPLGVSGMYLSQTLSSRAITGERRLYTLILVLISVTMIAFGVIISIILRGIITKPVLKIRRKIEAIARSDFSEDTGIEWDNELGDIGRGINDMSEKIVSLLESSLEDERKKRDLEYRMLQSQINPHFLYNTLNSIKWMATIQNASGIAEMTTALSRLMKNVIKGSRTTVPLIEEIALLDDYFLIQQYRYGSAIVFEKNIPDDLQWVSIPCFSLQPLMENAIFHGIEPKGGKGKITLTALRDNSGCVKIQIEDNGIGMTEEKICEVLSCDNHTDPSGLFREIGVSSVARRIQYSYGVQFGIFLESEIGLFTRATILVPYITINAPPVQEVGL